MLNIVACLAAFIAFLITGNAVMLFVALTVLCFLLAGGPAMRALAGKTDVTFSFKPACRVDGDLVLGIEVVRPVFFRGSIELAFECRNVFLDATTRVPVTLSPAPGRVERFELPLDTSRVGRVSVELVSARAVGVFGFAAAPLTHAGLSASYTVYPEVMDIEAIAHRATRAAMSGFVFDRYRKGQDLSEVFELRDYRGGDSMRAVHWKLTARFDELMVREPSHPADFDLAVVFGIHGRDAGLDGRAAVINASTSMLASVSRALLKRSLGHSVVYRNGSVLEIDPVDSEIGLERTLDAVLGTTVPVDVNTDSRPFAALQRTHGITKVVLVTDTVQEALFEEVGALCELTVIFLGPEGGLTVDDSGGYVLVRISAEAATSRVKSLEL